ncbi:hypothetical protein [uncultured Methanobrevibacter sp.]|uniref:hypothetical protein n=1 Tax=uncultured Methanobrevibacter sp. TaxID=253161 RepID=UPI0025FF2EC4|nr:hypothetical protein [uncultured Methanobrevibacter sp.]
MSADLCGYSISQEINIFKISIVAPEITSFTNVPQTLKIHLEGDKNTQQTKR